LRTRRAGQPSNEDAHADDHSNYLPIHESLPADSSPGCRLAPSGQPAATAMADPTIARLKWAPRAGRKSVRIASLFSFFSFAIFLDFTKRIFPDLGVPFTGFDCWVCYFRY
jgi:hypothetical protein